MMECYEVKQSDGSVKYYWRLTKEEYRERNRKYRERGYEKETVNLANGEKGFIWR